MVLSVHNVRKLLKNLVLTLALCHTLPSLGSHVMGGDITYKYIGDEKFSITIKIYRDCKGIRPFNYLHVRFVCLEEPGWTFLDSIPRTAINEITGLNHKVESRCSFATNGYGVEEHIYQTILDTRHAPEEGKTFSVHFGLLARNEGISTGAASEKFFTEAIIYKGDGINNSSPIFTTPAAAYVCLGEDFVFNNGAVDAIDNDILTYKLVEPLSDWAKPIPYHSKFSLQRPLTFLGFPNNNALLPQGFHLNHYNGNLSFRPIVANEITVLAVEVTERRWIDGVLTVVGKTRRDMQIIVVNCNGNKPPKITASNIKTCAEEEVCVPIGTYDENKDDSVSLSWAGGVTNATLTILKANNPTRDSGVLCWTPSKTHIRDAPYNFIVTATDNASPLLGRSSKAISIQVKRGNKPTFKVNNASQCLKDHNFSFTNTTPNKNLFNYRWELSDGRKNEGNDFAGVTFSKTGIYNIKLILEDTNGCEGTKTEVIKVKPHPIPNVSKSGLKPFYCFKANTPIPLPFISDTEYSGENVQNNTFTPKGVGKEAIRFKITVNGCSSDSVVPVKVFHKPNATISVDDDEQCFDSHLFHFTNNSSIVKGSLSYNWWLGDGRTFNKTKDIDPVKYQIHNTYITRLVALSDSGCTDTAIKTVTVHPEPNPQFVKLKNYYCSNASSFTLLPFQKGGVFSGKNVTDGVYKPENVGKDKITYTININGCHAESTQYIDVYKAPEFNFADKIYCYKNQPIVLDASFPDATYLWGNGSTLPSYTITSLGKYTITIFHRCDTIKKEVEVKDCFYGEYPNAFTPNNDGNNDVFLPFFQNAESMHLMIFNKWGEKIFEGNSLEQGWDGNYKGTTAVEGNYMWMVVVEYFDENQILRRQVKRGNITLLR